MPIRARLACAVVALSLSGVVAARDGWAPGASVRDGIWRAQGYGRIVALERGRQRLFHLAGPHCYRDPTVAADEAPFAWVRRIGANAIVFADAPDQTHYRFDRIAALPAACRTERAWRAEAIGALAAATFADLYPGFGQRSRSVATLTAALDTRGTGSDTATFDTMAAALATLDDAHVSLSATIDGTGRSFESGTPPTLAAVRRDAALGPDPATRERNWSRRDRDGIAALLAGGGRVAANRRILWGRIGRVGYLNIATMGAFDADAAPDDPAALDATLDAALAAFADAPGVIVDVTNNRGGYDGVALRIAGRFADRRRRAFAKRAVGATVPAQPFDVVPSERRRFAGPVLLVTSDITVSAGETFVLAMRALPNVRHVGARTRGALSDQLDKPLPNGWLLTLPAERYVDAQGRAFEGIGIDPVEPIAPFPDHAGTIAALARQLERR